MIANNLDFARFNAEKQTLYNLIYACENVFRELQQNTATDSLARLKSKLASERFKIMIIGEFKRGKSTFINALLGEEILPAFATPTTAVINEIKWGEDKKAILYFHNPVPQPLPNSIPEDARIHILRAKGMDVAPMDIAYDDLEEYVVIPDPAKDQAASVAETPYQKVELQYPVEWLKNGVELIDSPGLNEHKTREGVTLNYLPTADAILFVLSCSSLASESEMRVIKNDIVGNGHEEIFFICNRFDEIREKERDRIKNFGYAKLGGLTKFGNRGVYFLSALHALDGKMKNLEELLNVSGIIQLEEDLQKFLLERRGKVKILQPARELIHHMQKAREIIQQERPSLEKSLDELNHKYENVKPLLNDAERSKQQIISRINFHREVLRRTVFDSATIKLREVADQIPQWVEDMEPDNKIKLWTLKNKEGADALVQEISEGIRVKIEDEILSWKNKNLNSSIESIMNHMYEDLEGKIDQFYDVLNKVTTNFSGISISPDKKLMEGPSDKERFLTVVGGILIGDIALAAHGAKFGTRGLGRAIATQIAVGVGLALLGVANPLIFIGAAISGGLLNSILRTQKLNKTIKREIGEKYTVEFRNKNYEHSNEIAESIYKETASIVTSAEQYLNKEIQSKREQVEAVLKTKKEGEQVVAGRKQLLNKLEEKIFQIDKELKDLVLEMAQQ